MSECRVLEGKDFFEDNTPIYLNTASTEERSFLHKHDFIEIAYVASGKGIHIIGSEEYEVAKGDLCIINYGVPHVYTRAPEDANRNMVLYNCVFKPEFIDYSLIGSNDFRDIASSLLFSAFFVDAGPALIMKLSASQQLEIEEIYRKMQGEFIAKATGYINILRSCLIEMLTRVFRYLDSGTGMQTDDYCGKANIIGKALQFLKENYSSSDLNINEVAIRTFLSRSYFSRLFKDTTGQSFSRYLQNLRISEACSLLKGTGRKITDIMADVGFRDIKHFNLLFKQVTGMTPTEYRKK